MRLIKGHTNHTLLVYTPKSKKVALVDWRLVLGVWPFNQAPGVFWRKLLLGGAVCLTVVNRSMPAPYSQDLSWRVIWFVGNLGLPREEIAFYPGIFT